VIVTATRRNERLQDVPAQVSAVSGDVLQSLQARSLADFAALTPGVSFLSPTPSTDLIVVRGITTGEAQLNSAVGLYLDDVPIGSSTPFGSGSQAINLDTFDLNRVEVLNGPQGTLFGANALGGTVRYLSNAPQIDEFDGRIEGEVGDTDHGGIDDALRAFVNVPIDDQFALRLEGVDQNDSGWVDDPTHGRKNEGDSRTLQGRATLLYQATPDLSFTLNGYSDRITSNGLAAAFRDPTTHKPVGGNYDQSFASAQPSQEQLELVDGVIDWNLHWAKLTSISAYQDLKTDEVADLAVAYSAILGSIFGPVGDEPYTLNVGSRTKRFTQEARLASDSNDVFEWVAGAFYSNERTFQSDTIVNNADPNGLLLGLPIGHFGLPSTAREFALFGNATVYFSPTLDFTAGLRTSWDNQVFTSFGTGLIVNPFAPFTPITNTGKSNETTTTYDFNLRYRPTSETTLYARVASGYRPGGPNLATGGASSGNATFAPDSLWNYELGLKQGFSDGRGFFNASVYHIDWSNIQQVTNIGGVNQLVNAGDATVNGIDSSASFNVIPDLNLIASGSYTDAKLTTTAPILDINYTGARLPVSPRFSAAIAATYSFRFNDGMDGDVTLAYRYVGDRDAGYPGSATNLLYKLASYEIVDLTSTFRIGDGWDISPYVKNIFDTRGEISASTVTNEYVPAAPVPVFLTQPRTFGVVVGRNF
jgi:outer membrane receptor protein involved in Fe transport